MKAYERLLTYAKFNTQSSHESKSYPSTANQLVLGNFLKDELVSLGIESTIDEFGYVIGKIPANTPNKPSIALIAHMDTSPDASGENVNPQIVKNYQGGDILLNKETGMVLSPDVFESLKKQIGHTLITTDGHTLLGADDKAGVAEIMTFAEYVMSASDYLHGEIVIVFTPDEEVGQGTDFLDLKKVGADFGYTLDGSTVGEIAYENFNAAWAFLTFKGISVHPGSAKNKMLNSIFLAYEFDQLLPKYMRPETTEKYEGFNHLTDISGMCEETKTKYIIRNHSKSIFEEQKKMFESAVAFMNKKYGAGTVSLTLEDSYYNMRYILDEKQDIIDIAIAAIKECGLEPIIEPIRGGTDGARLTYEGLPCPNLGTGGYNYHGPYEYASVEEMDLAVEIIKKVIEKA